MQALRRVLASGFATTVVLSFGWLALDAQPARAQSTSPGCFAPCDAAFIYLDMIGYFTDGLASDVSKCKKQCTFLRKGCYNAVSSSERCMKGSLEAAFAVDRTNCSEYESSERGECTAFVNDNSKSFNDFLKSNVQCGRSACDEAYEDCVSSCSVD